MKLHRLPLFLLALISFSLAPELRALTAADQKEIQAFQLSDDLVTRYLAAVADGRKHKKDDSDTESDPKAAVMTSLDSLEAEIKRSPETVAAMGRHSLTTRQAVVAGIVLLRARMADKTASDPNMAKYRESAKVPNPENMAVYRKHKADIDKAMDEDDEND